jgi:hypothetical protein
MALILAPETYKRLEKRLGEDETKDFVQAVDAVLQVATQKNEEALARIESRADFLISQKKFELKDELTKELATKADVIELKLLVKADIERLEGMIKAHVERLEGMIKAHVERLEGIIRNMKVELDRKFTIMFLILLFTNILLNQNSLRWIAELLGLVKP